MPRDPFALRAWIQELSLFHIPASPAPPPCSPESLLTLGSLQGPALPAGASFPPDSHAGVALGPRAARGSAAFRPGSSSPRPAAPHGGGTEAGGRPGLTARRGEQKLRGCPEPPGQKARDPGDPALFPPCARTWKGAATHSDVLRAAGALTLQPAAPPPPSGSPKVSRSSPLGCGRASRSPRGCPQPGGRSYSPPGPGPASAVLLPWPRLRPRQGANRSPPGTHGPWIRDPASQDRPPFGWTISGGGRGVDHPHTRASPWRFLSFLWRKECICCSVSVEGAWGPATV